MKRSHFSDSQITNILKQAKAGATLSALCREHSISRATFYKWRSRYGGMDVAKMSHLRELKEENSRLKKMHADVQLHIDILQEALTKSSKAISATLYTYPTQT